jgi:hypothetical protein
MPPAELAIAIEQGKIPTAQSHNGTAMKAKNAQPCRTSKGRPALLSVHLALTTTPHPQEVMPQ